MTTEEWVKRMWYIYTGEFFSCMNMNQAMSFVEKWLQWEMIILDNLGQCQTDITFTLVV